MSAGTAASANGTTSNRYIDSLLTYTPRPLSQGKRNRREALSITHHNHRVVTVAEAENFALALRLEFDSTVRIYVELPRQLQLNQVGTAFELLPLVWASERISSKANIAAQVSDVLGRAECLNLSSMLAAIASIGDWRLLAAKLAPTTI
jgi:hypothetical protein